MAGCIVRLARWLCCALLAWIGLALPAHAAQDLVQQRSYLEDPGGALSITDIQRAQGWQSFTGPLPLRNKGTPFWVRLQVQPPPAGDWVVRVQPGLLQDIQVFQRTAHGAWEVQRLGSSHAYQARERVELAFSVLLHSPPGEAATVFVRVRSDSAIAHFKVISAQDSQEFDIRTHVLVGLYTGFSVVVM
ncbi:MAG: hypothetical protein J0H52_11435, partial [Comamonadaceae bacterium]|nr:hypothetical protein [Comamonadaceae bacterium]